MFYNENLIRLKELTEKISLGVNNDCNCDYKNILLEIKKIITSESSELDKIKTKNDKYNCYEKIFKQITNLMKKIE